MAELMAKSACDGLVPVTQGDLHLREAEAQDLAMVMPFKGQADALGVALPPVGQQAPAAGGVLRWFGKDAYLAIGATLPEGIGGQAAVSDQTDAWARLVLEGAQAEAVLARLVPVDLRLAHFPVTATCRSLLGHMSASITRVDAEAFEIMVFRSMAKTAVHEVSEAMGHVSARSSK